MILILTTIFVFLNVLDLYQTKTFLEIDPKVEANFMIRALYEKFGFNAVIIFKSIITLFVVLAVFTYKDFFSLLCISILCIIYSFVTIYNHIILKKYKEGD